MIKAEEIRIGNWYQHNENASASEFPGTLFQWTTAHWFDVERSHLNLASVDPIALTDEVLEAAGFEMDAAYQIPKWENKEGFFFFSESGTDYFSVRLMDRFDIEIQYLHQLQNLYYSLTGKELTYTPVTEKA